MGDKMNGTITNFWSRVVLEQVEDVMEVGARIRSGLGIRSRAQDK